MLDVESEIEQSEREFADLINELEGDEFDMLSTDGRRGGRMPRGQTDGAYR